MSRVRALLIAREMPPISISRGNWPVTGSEWEDTYYETMVTGRCYTTGDSFETTPEQTQRRHVSLYTGQ